MARRDKIYSMSHGSRENQPDWVMMGVMIFTPVLHPWCVVSTFPLMKHLCFYVVHISRQLCYRCYGNWRFLVCWQIKRDCVFDLVNAIYETNNKIYLLFRVALNYYLFFTRKIWHIMIYYRIIISISWYDHNIPKTGNTHRLALDYCQKVIIGDSHFEPIEQYLLEVLRQDPPQQNIPAGFMPSQ